MERDEALARIRLRAGLPPDHPALRVAEAVLLPLAPRSRRAYAGDLGDWLGWCATGRVGPLEAERRHVQAWLADAHRRRRDGTLDRDRQGDPVPLSRAARARRLSVVSAFYAEALEAGLRVRTTNPAARIPLGEEDPEADEPALTLEEVRAMLARTVAPDDAGPAARLRARRDRLALLLLLLTGLRAEEALSLTWGRLRRRDGHRVLEFRGKGRRRAVAKVRPDLHEALEAWREDLRAAGLETLDEDPILLPLGRSWPPALERRDGFLPALSHEALYDVVHDALGRVGRTGHRSGPHLLRRTSVTIVWQETGDLLLAQRHARHASADTTQANYIRPVDELTRAGTDALPFGTADLPADPADPEG